MHSKHKLAMPMPSSFTMPQVAGLMAMPMAMGAVAGGAEKVWNHFASQRAQAKGFKEMLDMHPNLREARDPVHVQRTYNSMFRANPEVASDPFVIGTIVSQVVAAHDHLGGSEGPTRFLTEYERLRGLQPRTRAESGLSAGVKDYSKTMLGQVLGAEAQKREKLEAGNRQALEDVSDRLNKAVGRYKSHRARGGPGDPDLDEAVGHTP